jgi:hypothetical protein
VGHRSAGTMPTWYLAHHGVEVTALVTEKPAAYTPWAVAIAGVLAVGVLLLRTGYHVVADHLNVPLHCDNAKVLHCHKASTGGLPW